MEPKSTAYRGERKQPMTLVIDSEEREFIEEFRQEHGMRSMADAARFILKTGRAALQNAAKR